MNLKKIGFRGALLLVTIAFMLSTVSCGTILYPKRRGQTSGRIDPGVAVLDGLGLLLFFIPGVVAFAVDFVTGAIYLPSGSSRGDLFPVGFQTGKVIKVNPASLNRRTLEAELAQQMGQNIELTSSETKVARMDADRDLVWGSISDVLTPVQLASFENGSNSAFD